MEEPIAATDGGKKKIEIKYRLYNIGSIEIKLVMDLGHYVKFQLTFFFFFRWVWGSALALQ